MPTVETLMGLYANSIDATWKVHIKGNLYSGVPWCVVGSIYDEHILKFNDWPCLAVELHPRTKVISFILS